MKLIYGLLFVAGCVSVSGQAADPVALTCSAPPYTATNVWDMDMNCEEKLYKQVQMEIDASIKYLSMGAYFAQDNVNKPGFSKFFLESASEEREHAMKIIEYLLMRGQLTLNINKLLEFPLQTTTSWVDGLNALKEALKLEVKVTNSIRQIIEKCEKPSDTGLNDYHLVDYLTGEFLDEQYKGQRDLAGKISTLTKMKVSHGALGEFLFDKKLLNGEF